MRRADEDLMNALWVMVRDFQRGWGFAKESGCKADHAIDPAELANEIEDRFRYLAANNDDEDDETA